MRPSTPACSYYGYDFRGLGENDDENIDDFFARDSTGAPVNANVAPYRPTYFAGYVQDRWTWDALTLDAGLRVEAFGSDATVPIDIYAPIPIVRAGDLDTRPDGIGSDYAVYYNFNGEGTNVVGYRDLDGTFYDASGSQTRQEFVTETSSGAGPQSDGCGRESPPPFGGVRVGADARRVAAEGRGSVRRVGADERARLLQPDGPPPLAGAV